jgi:hypothetical protein
MCLRAGAEFAGLLRGFFCGIRDSFGSRTDVAKHRSPEPERFETKWYLFVDSKFNRGHV